MKKQENSDKIDKIEFKDIEIVAWKIGIFKCRVMNNEWKVEIIAWNIGNKIIKKRSFDKIAGVILGLLR